MPKPAEHKCIDEEKAEELAQKFLMEVLTDNTDPINLKPSPSKHDETYLNRNLVIVCDECRRRVFEIIGKIGPQFENRSAISVSESAKSALANGFDLYMNGKKILQQMGRPAKDGIEQLLRQLSGRFNKLYKQLIGESADKYCEMILAGNLPSVPQKDIQTLTDTSSQIIVLRALLGKVLVIGDEEYLAECGFADQG